MKLDTEQWKEFQLGVLFEKMYKAKAHIKAEYDFQDLPYDGLIRFISRTEMNNGCDCYIPKESLTGIEQGNAIVIGDTTATCSYQNEPFVCGDHMVICRASWINVFTAIFLISILRKEKYKYSYGRAFKMDLISRTIVKLPVTESGTPDWQFMEDYIKSLNHKPITTKNARRYSSYELDTDKWKTFQVKDLFDVEYGINMELNTCVLADDEEDAINFVARTEENNGVSAKVKRVEGKVPQEVGIITCAGGGSVLSTFLQEAPFYSGRDLYLLKEKEPISRLAKLFFITVLKANKYRYSYGRQANKTLPYIEVKLPATSTGSPDWAFMEDYMKALPYGDKI